MPSRTWIKIYCDKWLDGTIREETPLVRSIWVDLLTLAGSGRYGDTGIIQLADNIGFTDEQIAAIIKISPNDWQTAKSQLLSTERISYNGTNVIRILNWQKYQSEYEKQRSYRERLQPEVTNNVVTKSYGEKEREKEKERGGENTIKDSLNYKDNITTKREYGEFQNVLLTDNELKKLTERFGESKTKELIEQLSTGIESKGYKYKSHYATILTWERKDKANGKTGSKITERDYTGGKYGNMVKR